MIIKSILSDNSVRKVGNKARIGKERNEKKKQKKDGQENRKINSVKLLRNQFCKKYLS
jgi:hypothetical protein